MTYEPKYSAKWVHKDSLVNFEQYLTPMGNTNLQFLEIGAFEGLSTNYFSEKFLIGENNNITCIDPWIKYSESSVTKMSQYDEWINEGTYEIFINNTKHNSDKIIIKKGFSKDVLPELVKGTYDFIYVDGDHSEVTVWLDAICSFPLLKINGIIIFDDYKWNHGDKSPEKAINRFMEEYSSRLEILKINYQVVLRKIKE